MLIEPGFAFFFELISGSETILNEADVPLTAVDQEAVDDDTRLCLYQRLLQEAQENDQDYLQLMSIVLQVSSLASLAALIALFARKVKKNVKEFPLIFRNFVIEKRVFRGR